MLSELKNARILYIDEVDIKKIHLSKLLEICGGLSATVSCKYTGAYTTSPMPVVLLSNGQNAIPMEEGRWQKRVTQFKVRTLPADIFDFEQQIHPVGWLSVFDECL